MRIVGSWAAALLVGCVPARGGWDRGALEQQYPALREIHGSRLGDTPPYFVPEHGGLALFLCRWPGDAPIGVSLPPGASEAERGPILRALEWWEQAGPGVELEVVPRESAQIEILLRDADGAAPRGSGDTAADCVVADDLEAPPGRARVDARMSFASIHLRRHDVDALGRLRPLSADELAGAAAHELGHALGFAGHVARGESPMSLSPEVVRRVGARINRGERFEDPTLRALYALPSGVVVGRLTLRAEQDRSIRRLARLAREAGLRGPLVRAGDRDARIFWRDDAGAATALTVRGWGSGDREPDRLVFEPNRAARRLLAR